jgi:lysine 6-dehydrogenase
MSRAYAVLGSGMQGTAAAYDLARHGGATELVLIDREEHALEHALERIRKLIPTLSVTGRIADAADTSALRRAVDGVAGVFSGLPYGLNPGAAAVAVDVGAHFCDLGGNTDVVRRTLALDHAAKKRGVSVIPDCGLAPGLGNVLAAALLQQLPGAHSVHIRCGGLPRYPRPPLNYMLVFNIGGLTNEYMGEAEFLRDGQLISVPTLSECEGLEFPTPVGKAEAFVTSGGTSTAPETFASRVRNYDYKTVRYPGHCAQLQAIKALGLWDLEPVTVGGATVRPRDLFHALAAPRLLPRPGDTDLVVLRADVLSAERGLRLELLDFADSATGFSAMERTTAFPAAATLAFQVEGRVPVGATTSERLACVGELVDAVRARGLDIRSLPIAAR